MKEANNMFPKIIDFDLATRLGSDNPASGGNWALIPYSQITIVLRRSCLVVAGTIALIFGTLALWYEISLITRGCFNKCMTLKVAMIPRHI